MILVTTDRRNGDIDVFSVKAITDVSKDSRTVIEVEHVDGEKDKIDLHTYKVDIFPRSS